MARQRKAANQNAQTSAANQASNGASTKPKSKTGLSRNSSKDSKESQTGSSIVSFKWLRNVVGTAVLIVAAYFGYRGYLETRVNTPFDDQKMVVNSGLYNPDLYWGSYRPGTYFGLKTRDPQSLVMGLMWYYPRQLLAGSGNIRHWCEIGDNLEKYGWIQHDGRTFGVQEIHDGPYKFETSFVKSPGGKYGGDWTARVQVTNTTPVQGEVTLLWYTALDEKTVGFIEPLKSGIGGISGQTTGLGKFELQLHAIQGKVLLPSYLSTVTPGLHLLKETVQSYMRLANVKPNSKEKTLVLAGEVLTDASGSKLEPNFIATQITVRTPFTLDISYQSISDDAFTQDLQIGPRYTALLAEKRREFSDRFERKFKLVERGYAADARQFAEAALSNMLGGVGYFYGASRVQSAYTKEPVPYWRAPLFTAVPSRSFFPRGFLWDEGFHGLLITRWDVDLELDILTHWFDLMNVEGWIPREQILGPEALAKVPEEFVTQRNSNANPPTFFLTLKTLLDLPAEQWQTKARLATLHRLYPRLQAWFGWFNTTQRADTAGAYRWKGRDELTVRELNPKTLTSGLDDFPRASHPSSAERHLDLRCWIALAAGVMADLAKLLGRNADKYEETHEYLTDVSLLNELHFSARTDTYADFGLHTDSVVLKRPPATKQPGQPPQTQAPDMVRFVLKPPEPRLVDSTFGYVNLFPFLMTILPPTAPALEKVLVNLRDPAVLWSDFGLRSLSKRSPLYMQRNTEHDPPYWRGQIWLNINYLALRALHRYGELPGPYSGQARKIYAELRSNLVTNLLKQYKETGYIWEQYNDSTGQGSGCKPFTGWSSLVVLIMAEQY